MSELFWERIGFTLTGIIFGLVYAAAVSAIAYSINSTVNILGIFQVFVVVFGVSGLLMGNVIVKSVQGFIYALYVLYGFIMGVFGYAVSTEELLPNKINGLLFVAVGTIAGVLCFLSV